MSQQLLEKINHIEALLIEINSKLDNFLGLENLSVKEKKEVAVLREQVDSGDYKEFDEVFRE